MGILRWRFDYIFSGFVMSWAFVCLDSVRESRQGSKLLRLMAPTSPSPSNPPSPVPFVPTAPESSRSPTWDEYLDNSSNNSFDLVFPVNVNFGDPVPRETRPSFPLMPSVSGCSSFSQPGYPQHPQRRLSPALMNHKRKASPLPSPLPSPVSFPMVPDTMPPAVTFPLSVMRPDGMTLVQPEMRSVSMKTMANPDTPTTTQVGRWTKGEHELFLEGLQRFGKSWKKISSLVHTRTLVQIRTHAQKYLQKQTRAAIKADAKVAEAASQQQQRLPQHQLKGATDPHTPQLNAPTLRQWKSRDNSGFAPLAVPNALSRTSSSTSPHSAFQLNSINRLDQLLQDDNNTIPAFADEHYTSPTAIEDDLLRPVYTGEQWASRLTHPEASTYPNKRRRVEPSASGPTSVSIAVLTLRPAILSAAFEPLPVPDNLSSPSNSQSTTAAALLAAHETEETTNYTNAWL